MQNSNDFLELAEALANSARPVSMRYFRQRLTVEVKPDRSPVTIADREIESLMRRRIRERFPSHGILGEEYGSEQLTSEFLWVIDPIDGTKSFITGMPTFGTLISLLHERTPHLGVIDMPALGERWVAAAGRPTTFNGQLCRTRDGARLSEAVLYSTSPQQFDVDDVRRSVALFKAVGLHRYGGDCYAYGLLACGLIDGVVEASLQPYDYLSLVPVVQGAGGVITDWDGKPLDIDSDGRVLAAASAQLHAQMLEKLVG